MPSQQEAASTGDQLRVHGEPVGDDSNSLRNNSNTYPDASNYPAITSLASALTNPRRYNRVRRIFSPFPILTNQLHAYLSLLSVEAYLQDVERISR